MKDLSKSEFKLVSGGNAVARELGKLIGKKLMEKKAPSRHVQGRNGYQA